VGLKRAGFDRERVQALKKAFKILFFQRGNMKLALERVEAEVPLTADVRYLLEFIRQSKRGVAMGAKSLPSSDEL
jgi:UDP-N-acetylglucosamine acyltransferase